MDCLKARESDLLRELDNILASYLSYRGELDKVNEKRISLERTKSFLQNELQTSPIKSVHEDCITRVNTEIESIEIPIKPKIMCFECDSNKVLAQLDKFGNLGEIISVNNYKIKKQLVMNCCEKGKETEQLDNPLGVTVDNKTGNIYIADQSNNCVKVFDSTGKYLFKFGNNRCGGKLNWQRGLAICGDRIIISQSNNCIHIYELNGILISIIGNLGKGELQFNVPFGLTIDELNKDIYICDCYNNRIQILCENLSLNVNLV